MPTIDISSDIWQTFPRVKYTNPQLYTFPDRVNSAHILWAARAASAAWAAAAANSDEATLIHFETFTLAVFDKAHELKEAQWDANDVTPHMRQWAKLTNGFINVAYLLATKKLALISTHTPPSAAEVKSFCRAAMNSCAFAILDARPLTPTRLDLGRLGIYHECALEYAYGRLAYGGRLSDGALSPAYIAVEAEMTLDPETDLYNLRVLPMDWDPPSDGATSADTSAPRERASSSKGSISPCTPTQPKAELLSYDHTPASRMSSIALPAASDVPTRKPD